MNGARTPSPGQLRTVAPTFPRRRPLDVRPSTFSVQSSTFSVRAALRAARALSFRRPLEDARAHRRDREHQTLRESIGLDVLGHAAALVSDAAAAVVLAVGVDELLPESTPWHADPVVVATHRREMPDDREQRTLRRILPQVRDDARF